MKSLVEYDITINPNMEDIVYCTGSYVKYKSGSGNVRVKTPEGSTVNLSVGQGVRLPPFTELRIQDTDGVDSTRVFLVGDGEFIDNVFFGDMVIKTKPVAIRTSTKIDVDLNSVGEVLVISESKEVFLYANVDNEGAVYIGKQTNHSDLSNHGYPLFPGEKMVISDLNNSFRICSDTNIGSNSLRMMVVCYE